MISSPQWHPRSPEVFISTDDTAMAEEKREAASKFGIYFMDNPIAQEVGRFLNNPWRAIYGTSPVQWGQGSFHRKKGSVQWGQGSFHQNNTLFGCFVWSQSSFRWERYLLSIFH